MEARAGSNDGIVVFVKEADGNIAEVTLDGSVTALFNRALSRLRKRWGGLDPRLRERTETDFCPRVGPLPITAEDVKWLLKSTVHVDIRGSFTGCRIESLMDAPEHYGVGFAKWNPIDQPKAAIGVTIAVYRAWRDLLIQVVARRSSVEAARALELRA
jgi:hypothetical protein